MYHFVNNVIFAQKMSNKPVKNWRSLNLPKISFITLFVLFLKTLTSSGLFSSNFWTNLKQKKHKNIEYVYEYIIWTPKIPLNPSSSNTM
jgi:hypothetical protein